MNEAPLGKAGRDVDTLHVRERNTSAPPSGSTPRRVPQANGVSLAQNGTLIHPEPRRGVYRSSTGINVPPAAELWNLLHLDEASAVAQSNGRYRGRRVPITLNDLERHLAGEITLGFSALHYNRALFASLDVDALFRELLPRIREDALAIGGEDLCAAIFCTSGSDAGRGKVIVTFTQPVPARDARKLIQHLCRRVRASEPAQYLRPCELAAFPMEKSGGVVRVLGRNPGRDGPMEQAFSLDGEPGVSHLRPLKPAKVAQIVSRLGEAIAPWAKRLLERPWLRREGTDRHYRWMVALARDAIRLGGRTRGCRHYEQWLETSGQTRPSFRCHRKRRRIHATCSTTPKACLGICLQETEFVGSAGAIDAQGRSAWRGTRLQRARLVCAREGATSILLRN